MTDAATEDLSPAGKLVLFVLERADEPLTQSEIAEHSRLNKTTVRQQLYQLEDAGLVDSDYRFKDVRQKIYRTVKC
ncbi:hypothetical protein GCM10009646_79330 [Streptomyces aureus]